MLKRAKELELVGKLLQLTTAGRLEWTYDASPEEDHTFQRSEVYESCHKELLFRLYKVKRKVPRSETEPFKPLELRVLRPAQVFGGAEWITYTVLDIIDTRSKFLVETITDAHSNFASLNRLYQDVRNTALGVDAIIDAILAEDINGEQPLQQAG